MSHLLFADDTFICSQETVEAKHCTKGVLETYAATSGQMINLQKSVVVFSKNAKSSILEVVPTILGIRLETQHEKYLSLHSIVGRSKKAVFSSIQERVRQKVQSWSEKNVSSVRRDPY